MPEVSARQIVTTALRLLGVASAETPLEADMAQSGLDALNSMLDGWATERLLTWTRPTLALPLVPGQGTYTWGLQTPPALPADLPYETPVRVELCLLRLSATPQMEWPVQILEQIDYEAGLSMKTLTSTYPSYVYLEQSEPVALLHVWPVPESPHTLILLPWTASAPYQHFDHALSWPNGYARAMQFNLAVELAPQYGVDASNTVLRLAEDAKRLIGNVNVEVGALTSDYGGMGTRGDVPAVDMAAFYRGWA